MNRWLTSSTSRGVRPWRSSRGVSSHQSWISTSVLPDVAAVVTHCCTRQPASFPYRAARTSTGGVSASFLRRSAARPSQFSSSVVMCQSSGIRYGSHTSSVVSSSQLSTFPSLGISGAGVRLTTSLPGKSMIMCPPSTDLTAIPSRAPWKTDSATDGSTKRAIAACTSWTVTGSALSAASTISTSPS